jgi:hypothetical protein
MCRRGAPALTASARRFRRRRNAGCGARNTGDFTTERPARLFQDSASSSWCRRPIIKTGSAVQFPTLSSKTTLTPACVSGQLPSRHAVRVQCVEEGGMRQFPVLALVGLGHPRHHGLIKMYLTPFPFFQTPFSTGGN